MLPASPCSGSSHSGRGRGGFTLAELMVVVVILGLISGVVYVSWQAVLPNQRLNTAVRNLSEVLHEARAQAIANSKEYQIHYDLDASSYGVRTPFRLLGGGYAVAEEEPRLWIRETNLERDYGVTIQEIRLNDETYVDGKVFVPFSPLGASAGHTIVLRQEQFDRTFTIEVLPLTGDIRFHDGVYEREPADQKDFL